MTALLTQCPHCQTSFRVSTAQMSAAHGLVRCGSCLGVFSAEAHEIRIRTPDGYLVEELETDDDDDQSLSENPADATIDTIEPPDADIELPLEPDYEQHEEVPTAVTDDHDDDVLLIRTTSTMLATNDQGPWINEPDGNASEVNEKGFNDALIDVSGFEEFVPEAPEIEEPEIEEPEIEEPEIEKTAPIDTEAAIQNEGTVVDEPQPWHADNDPVVTLGDMKLDDFDEDYAEENQSPAIEEHAKEEYADDDVEQYSDDEEDDCEDDEAYGLSGEQTDSTLSADATTDADEDQKEDRLTELSVEPKPRTEKSARHQPPLSDTVTVAPEKRGLHQRLSALTANDEFDPVNDDQLDALETLPVTITHDNNFRSQAVNVALSFAALLLLLALPLPWLYTNRDTLANHPRFAFMAPLVCNYFTCKPSTDLDLTSIYSQQLLVRSHPRYQDALEVSFIFHNDATLPRPFPLVELAFSDLSNNLLANRLFKPQEYLPAELRQLAEMPAQSTVQVTLELEDPGKEAVNYTVKLYPPTP